MIEFMVKLQEYRTPLLNKIAEIVTITAEETFLIAVMCLVFWCLSRENGYKLILSIIFASALNSALKLLYKVDRPWVKDSRIVPLRQQTAGGYSMPSGHTQVGASLWFSLRRSYRKTWFTIIAYVMMILIAASRVYLGVHTPQDVLIGLALSIAGVLIAHYLADKALKNNSVMPFAFLAILAFAGLFFFRDENYYKMTGLLISLPLAFYLENRFVKFEAKTKWWKQLIKIIIGFVVVMAFKEGLKLVFPDTLVFDTIRYFIVGIAAIYAVTLIFVKTKLAISQK